MLEKQYLSHQRIFECLNINYGIEVAKLTLLPIGADMNASVYKAEAKHQSYFVKLKRGHHHDIIIDIIELLQKADIHQIIHPVKTTLGRSTQHIDDSTLIVYPFIEGNNGFSRALTSEQWITMGNALRQVHEIDVPSSIQNRLRRETYSSKWREIVRSLGRIPIL